MSAAQAARVFGVSLKIVSRWVARFKAMGRDGMRDRSSRPKTIPRQTDQVLAQRIIALRRQRLTEKHIAIESLGITVTRVMTDNGSCYIAKDFAKACKALGLKYIRTKPYTPKTNGKAERFIQTALREWAYAGLIHHQRTERRTCQTGPTCTIGIVRMAV